MRPRTIFEDVNVVSAMLRFVCGITLIVAACITHRRIEARVAAGDPMQIAGVTIGASPGGVSLALWVVGLIGALLIILGIVTLMRNRVKEAAQSRLID